MNSNSYQHHAGGGATTLVAPMDLDDQHLPAMPDQTAFQQETMQKQLSRSAGRQRHHSASGGLVQGLMPMMTHAGMIMGGGLSASHGRAQFVCPATPAKSPAGWKQHAHPQQHAASLHSSMNASQIAAAFHIGVTPQSRSLNSSHKRSSASRPDSRRDSLNDSIASDGHSDAGNTSAISLASSMHSESAMRGLNFGSPARSDHDETESLASSEPGSAKRSRRHHPSSCSDLSRDFSHMSTEYGATAAPAPAEPALPDLSHADIIGQGAFSTCYRCVDPSTGETVAVKVNTAPFKGHNDRESRGMTEVRNLERIKETCDRIEISALHHTKKRGSALIDPNLDHHHIVQYTRHWFDVPHMNHLYIQTALATGGDVHTYLSSPLSSDALQNPQLPWLLLHDVARGLRFLHTQSRMVHLDLKWENVFIFDGGILRIGDFGHSQQMTESDNDRLKRKLLPGAHTPLGASFSSAFSSAMNTPSPAATTSWSTASPSMHDGYREFPPLPGLDDTPSSASSAYSFDHPSALFAASSSSTNASSSGREIPDGDSRYIAQEVLQNQPLTSGGAPDIFALGLMILEVTFNVRLANNGDEFQLLRQNGWRQVMGEDALRTKDPELLSLIDKMLQAEPANRITAEAILKKPNVERAAQGQLGLQARAALAAWKPPPISQPQQAPQPIAHLGPAVDLELERALAEHQFASSSMAPLEPLGALPGDDEQEDEGMRTPTHTAQRSLLGAFDQCLDN